jgi:hypothetical protein
VTAEVASYLTSRMVRRFALIAALRSRAHEVVDELVRLSTRSCLTSTRSPDAR